MRRCKITVLKREFNDDLAKQYIKIPNFGLCHLMKEGDTFITSGPFGCGMPENFCDMAWHAIELQATSLATVGKVFGVDDVHIACCNDGVRPVIFKLEAIEDDSEQIF
ncbi:MAG: TIGR04076 family protein [Erysipelotrichaceae bacterium]|nr:TIGR04076 family protein [Erysipelotrichaceae bacterium]